ncbi:cysteine--tRNA ligase [Candidatus Nomurabacteria bacterium]|nr:cysteine--tRNA ligase [Candidatus Nomurabacteria bacterium]
MALTIYNTLSRKKEEFKVSSKTVSVYACGPTVYDQAHIGNLRTYVFNDLLRRVLEFNGHEVKQVMNITDVDDKIIKASQEQNIPPTELTKKYEKLFLADLDKLNIKRANITPRATDFVPQMIELINRLLNQKVAYIAPDGVYFDIKQAQNYGKLSGRGKPENPAQEENFALWKFWKEGDGSVFWGAPFGKGRPGWHTECSAMLETEIGETVDIHTGGSDLIFPHHENEIAQSETLHEGRPLARYWLHGGLVNFSDEKMSKSLGNFITLKTLEERGINPVAYRFWILMAKYRTTVNFTWEVIGGAQKGYDRLKNRVANLPDDGDVDEKLRQEFLMAINDDLNTAKALTIIPNNKKTWLEFNRVFGLSF